jgi:F-type H+-transporting ATPase subunit b
MPQLDPTVFAPQLVWLAISFVALYVLLTSYALPKIGGVLASRKEQRANDLAQAEAFREQAEQAMANYETALAEARTRALAIAQQARDEAAADLARQEAELDARLAERSLEAEAKLAASRDQAVQSIREAAETIVGDIVMSTSGLKAPAKSVAEAVSAELANRKEDRS